MGFKLSITNKKTQIANVDVGREKIEMNGVLNLPNIITLIISTFNIMTLSIRTLSITTSP